MGNIFLRNVDLLEEIEKSKLSFCCYATPEDTKFDLTFQSYETISPTVINDYFVHNPEKEFVVFRIMTDEHIVTAPLQYKLDTSCASRMPPFKHFRLNKSDFKMVMNNLGINLQQIGEMESKLDGLVVDAKSINAKKRVIPAYHKHREDEKLQLKRDLLALKKEIHSLKNEILFETDLFNVSIRPYLKEILRSHWTGKNINEGHLSYTRGKITDKLAQMIIMLAERYIKAGNWSGYTYTDDMKATGIAHLCEVILKFDASQSNNPFAYMTRCVTMSYISVLNKEKEQRSMKSIMMQELGYAPSFGEQQKDIDTNNMSEYQMPMDNQDSSSSS